jgi:carbon storage regulator CsrA
MTREFFKNMEGIMLVLSRKKGQELVIGDDIRIVINRVTGNRVTIGIEAPGGVSIVRGELTPEGNVFQRSAPVGEPAAARGVPATK